MIILSAFLTFLALSSVVLGLLVFLKNSRSAYNRLFLGMATCVSGWIITNNFFDNYTVGVAYVLAFMSYFFALMSFIFLLFFISSYYYKYFKWHYFSLLTAVALVLSLPGVSATGVNSNYEIQTTSLVLVYGLSLLSLLVLCLYLLVQRVRSSVGAEARSAKTTLYGLFVSMMVGVTTNLLLPITGNYDFVTAGPAGTVFMLVAIGYSIIRHGFLNIRFIVARSLGYIFALGVLISVFAFGSSVLVRTVFVSDPNGSLTIFVNAVFLAIAALTYPVLKKFFDRYTNRFFFRDAYDPQEFLDQLNKSIVSNIEIGILLRHTTAVIEENIKSSFVQVAIPKSEAIEGRIVGTKEAKYTEHELNYMRGRLVGLGRKIVTADDLGPEEDELQKIFNKHDISILVHLSANSYGQSQTIAYMIFGNKKSGNIYSKADLKIIEIIADELVIAIQNALRFEEIQDFNVTLQNKVNNATNKLRKTNDKLKAMDETKDEFISMASHQLRTPLTSVKGYLSMVLEGDAGEINDTQRKLLDQAFVSSQRMVYLIADLLNVSRLRTGKFMIDAHPANLAVMVDGEISQLIGQAKAKNIEMTFEKPTDFPELLIDETKTRQVVMNFVDNALYYTPSGGKIDVSLTQDKGHVYFQVKDNGLGVPKDEQKHLFTKFYRAKNARNIRPDGTGLGLFMAKKVITGQGGNILFSSTEGKGSTFGFSFNKKHLALERAEELKQENLASS